MNELLGLIDALEATVLEGSKIPMTGRVMLDEHHILSIIDKIRLTIKAGGSVRDNVELHLQEDEILETENPENTVNHALKEAKKQAFVIKKGANDYADQVLAQLQLVVTKFQKDMIRFENNILSGREVLQQHRHDCVQEELEALDESPKESDAPTDETR
ncbi:MAG: hypothetical protein AB7F28_00535 [Candidatus Margulisiibacteriota bacterium]